MQVYRLYLISERILDKYSRNHDEDIQKGKQLLPHLRKASFLQAQASHQLPVSSTARHVLLILFFFLIAALLAASLRIDVNVSAKLCLSLSPSLQTA